MIDTNEIEALIHFKQEGSYWDFKREWYLPDKKHDLVHDILCFANNLVSHDCYIIIGVDEENDYALKSVGNDANRKKTQDIVRILADKKFVGNVRPVVWVETINIGEDFLDVICIKNTYDTPYYLTERFQQIQAYHIYTRVQDTNTPIDRSADINHVEYLWKKRFRLLESPYERLKYYLTDKENWLISPVENETIRYYKFNPEFTIEEIETDRDGYEFYLFSQTDPRPHWLDFDIKYRQTVIESFGGALLDGARYITSCPNTGFINFNHYFTEEDSYSYKYFIKNEVSYLLHLLLFNEESFDSVVAHDKFLECVLIYDSIEEKDRFEEYIKESKELFMERINTCPAKIIEKIPNYRMSVLERQLKTAYVLKTLLKEYRNSTK